jgi:hypothetical protein
LLGLWSGKPDHTVDELALAAKPGIEARPIFGRRGEVGIEDHE